jgi:hypothetical protein
MNKEYKKWNEGWSKICNETERRKDQRELDQTPLDFFKDDFHFISNDDLGFDYEGMIRNLSERDKRICRRNIRERIREIKERRNGKY